MDRDQNKPALHRANSSAVRKTQRTAQPTPTRTTPAPTPAPTPVRRPALRRTTATITPRTEKPSRATAPTNASRSRQANAAQNKAPAPARRPSNKSSLNDRALPPLPLDPSRSPPRTLKQAPPPPPLSERPLLPLGQSPTPARNSTQPESRRFHMHGQTYDKVMAPLQSDKKNFASSVRPSSSSSVTARVGPLTDTEITRSDGQPTRPEDLAGIDIKQYVTNGYAPKQMQKAPATATGRQPKPSQICLGVNCRGVHCRVCTPAVRFLTTPEQKAAEERERRELQSKSLLSRRPEIWSPKTSSPLRQSEPCSPGGDVSPLTPPHSPVEAKKAQDVEWPIKASAGIKNDQVEARAETKDIVRPVKAQVQKAQVQTKDAVRPKKVPAETKNIPEWSVKASQEKVKNPLEWPVKSPVQTQDGPVDWDIAVIHASRQEADAELHKEAIKERLGWGDVPDDDMMEWDLEAIKASQVRRGKREKREASCNSLSLCPPPTNICWEKDPRANRAMNGASTTAVAYVLKTLQILPPEVQEADFSVVAIDTVAQKRPQIHAGSDDGAAAAQFVEHEYTGDYTTSWPESAYYFGDRDSLPTIGERIPVSDDDDDDMF